MDLVTLEKLLNHSWCAETALGKWDENIPSLNQCAVTALVVQDYLGGDMLRCLLTNGVSHYWNRLPNGTEVDLTSEQFNFIDATPIKEDVVVRDREYVLANKDTLRRYHLLKKLVGDLSVRIL